MLTIEQALAEHDYAAAYNEIIRDFAARHEGHTKRDEIATAFLKDLDELLLRESRRLLEEKNYGLFVQFIEDLSVDQIRIFTREDFVQYVESLQSPELAELVIGRILNRMDHAGPSKFSQLLNQFSSAGILTKENILGNERIRKEVRRIIIDRSEYPEQYVLERDMWAQTGVITIAEANELPEIVAHARQDVLSHKDSPHIYQVKKDSWVRSGVLSRDVVDSL